MSVCGYHPLMGEGLKTFAQGLLLALQEKARRNGRPIEQHMYVEADEITILTNFLEKMKATGVNSPDTGLGFLGIVYVCQSLMGDIISLAQERGDLTSRIQSNVEQLITFLQSFEDSFESCSANSALAKTRFAWSHVTREVASDEGNLANRSKLKSVR